MQNADYVLVFKALADETRLKIARILEKGEFCACDILEHFQITQPTLSYHMKILCDSGLVDGRREGAWMRYRLNTQCIASMQQLFQYFGVQDCPQANSCCGDSCCDGE